MSKKLLKKPPKKLSKKLLQSILKEKILEKVIKVLIVACRKADLESEKMYQFLEKVEYKLHLLQKHTDKLRSK